MLKPPHFKSETEEATWWFTHQDEIADELERVKPKLGPSRAMRMLSEARAKTGTDDGSKTDSVKGQAPSKPSRAA